MSRNLWSIVSCTLGAVLVAALAGHAQFARLIEMPALPFAEVTVQAQDLVNTTEDTVINVLFEAAYSPAVIASITWYAKGVTGQIVPFETENGEDVKLLGYGTYKAPDVLAPASLLLDGTLELDYRRLPISRSRILDTYLHLLIIEPDPVLRGGGRLRMHFYTP